MNAPDPSIDSLLARLSRELDEASAGVRVTPEWKEVRRITEELRAEREALLQDADALDTAVRTLEAQLDMLALTREEVAEQDRLAEQERERREREDRLIIAANRSFLAPYSLLAIASVVLAPVLGVPFGEWCLLAALPGGLGYLEMRRRTQLMVGRNWVVLNDEVRLLAERTRLYDIIAGVGVLISVGGFLLIKAVGYEGT